MNSTIKTIILFCCCTGLIISMDEPTGAPLSTNSPFFHDAVKQARQFIRKNSNQINAITDVEQYASEFIDQYRQENPFKSTPEFLTLIKQEIYRTILSSKIKIEEFIKQAEKDARALRQSSALKKDIPTLTTDFKQKHNIPDDQAFDQIIQAFESVLQRPTASRSPQQSPTSSLFRSPQNSLLQNSLQLSPQQSSLLNSSDLSSPGSSPQISPQLSPRLSAQENNSFDALALPPSVAFEPAPYTSERQILSDRIIEQLHWLETNKDRHGSVATANKIYEILQAVNIDTKLGKLKHPSIDPRTGQRVQEHKDAAAQRALSKILKKPHSMFRLTDEQLKLTDENLTNYIAWLKSRP